MTDCPQLAVIMTHYDCADYLGEAVGSVLHQSFRDLTLFLVDDDTPHRDWVGAIHQFRDDPRLQVFVSSRNVGTYRLKSAMIERVHSPYIGFHDSDDVSLVDRFARQIAALQRRRLDIIGCGLDRIDHAGRSVGNTRFPRRGNWLEKLGKTYFIHHPASTVRRAVFDRIGSFDPTTRIGADSDFFLRAAQRFRIGNLQEILYRYRQLPSSLTGSSDTGYGSEIRDAYWKDVMARWKGYRRARNDEALRPPPGDTPFTLNPFVF